MVPEDGVNLNRAFPGDSAGSLSARLAFALETALYPEADLLADLHSGDCNEALHPLVFFPTAGEEMVNQVSLAAAKRDDQSLKNLDCTVEKIHKILCRERSAVFRRPLCFIPGAPFKNNIN